MAMAYPAKTLNLRGSMKCFFEAMKLDEDGRNQEAYIEYLSCLQFISGSLCEEAKQKTSTDDLISGDSQKMMNLVQKCTERLVELQSALATPQQTARTVASSQSSPPAHHLPDVPSHPSLPETSPHTTLSPPTHRQGRDGVHTTPMNSSPQLSQHKPAPNVGQPPSPTRSIVPRKRSLDQLSPIEKAYRENRLLMVAYSARLKKITGSKNQSAVNLTFQRRLMENMAIAREREKQLAKKIKERHEHLQRLAEEKLSKGGGLSRDALDLQRAYAEILEYENRNLWIQEQHERLRASPRDPNAIQVLIKDIIKDQAHPFSQLLKHYQDVICEKLRPLIEKQSSVDIRVPLPDGIILELCERKVINADSFEESKAKGPLFDDEFMARLLTFRNSERYEEMLRDVGQEIVSWEGDEMFEELLDELIVEGSEDMGPANQVKSQRPEAKGQREMDNVMKEVEEGEEETPASVMGKFKDIIEEVRSDLNAAAEMSVDTSNQNVDETTSHDEYSVDGEGDDSDLHNNGTTSSQEPPGVQTEVTDDIEEVDSVDDNVTQPKVTDDDQSQSESSSSASSSRRESEQEVSEKEKVKRLKKEALERHMENLSKEIKQMIEKLVTLLVAVYEELSSAVAKEQCLTLVECHFFPGIWPSLFALFRRINEENELQVATAMTRYLHALPEHIGIAERFCLKSDSISTSDDHYPYYPVVEDLLEVPKLECPADKLECLVRVSSGVIQCVNQHYDTKHVTVGCDDLLPILSYVLLKSGIPSIVSEVNAMETFIQEGYLFGKEGYCLTTIQTALSYVFKLSAE